MGIFDEVADAYSWLQHTRFAHLDAAVAPDSAFEWQAEFASRVAELAERLRHCRKVARLPAGTRRHG